MEHPTRHIISLGRQVFQAVNCTGKAVAERVQPVDVDVARLSNAMAAVLSLSVHRWIPVRVIEDDGVCSGQVDAETAGPRRQDETEYPLVCIEPFHQYLALLHLDMSTTPLPVIQVVFCIEIFLMAKAKHNHTT